MAPRAAALAREGERDVATDLLGHYLATAPDDGRAWFQLGRFYLLDARDWHGRGHEGEPSGLLYLDFAATAFDQSVRLAVDSGVVYRDMVEMGRALIYVEEHGWADARMRAPGSDAPPLPDFLLELGDNLLNSCPSGGVLLTGSDLEAVSVWYASSVARRRPDLLPLQPDLYAVDSVYRRSMAGALNADPSLPVRQALALVATRRPICMSPLADSGAVPSASWHAVRLVRVSGVTGTESAEPLTVTDLVRNERRGTIAWVREVEAIYHAAARHNTLLCAGILTSLGDRSLEACGR
ncbi:MAG: hypothetical protein ABJD11_08130 [Gemmatimonadota bacterium]